MAPICGIAAAQHAAALAADDHTTALMATGISAPVGVGLTFNRLPIEEAIDQLVGPRLRRLAPQRPTWPT